MFKWYDIKFTIYLPFQILINNFIRFILQVLDEEAEVFVVKMWRLLIYEVEAKKDGLGKWKTKKNENLSIAKQQTITHFVNN